MKLIRKSRLALREGNSDKVYEVDLCDVSTHFSNDQFVVNFRYGRRGAALREGTKTPKPVSREKADKLFDSLVVSKTNKGYSDSSQVASSDPTSERATMGSSSNSRYDGAVERAKTGLFDIATEQLKDANATRIIWRAGEIGAPQLTAPLLKLLESSDQQPRDQNQEMHNYSLLWALGRCGDNAIFDHVKRFSSGKLTPLIQRMALWASLRLSTDKQRLELLAPLLTRLPESLATVIDASDRLPVHTALDTFFSANKLANNDTLHDLYLLSYDRQNLREALLKILPEIPFKPNYFRGVRQIFKAAEFFRDAEVFGLLNLRFDLTRAYFVSPVYSDYVSIQTPQWQSFEFSKEIRRPKSRLAYSSKTRAYLRHRSWRSLRKLGELGLDDYVEMAMGVLLACRSLHLSTPRETRYFGYDNITGRSIEYVNRFDELSDFICLVSILHRNSQRYTLLGSREAWKLNTDHVTSDSREEAFPELWDRHPDALLRLLLDSDIEQIHQFACRALFLQQDYCATIAIDDLLVLLNQGFDCTVEFVLHLAKNRYDPANPNFKLVFALLDSSHNAAVAQAKDWVNAQPATFSASVEFVLAVVTARTGEVRQWGRLLLESSAQSNAHELVQAILSWLLKRGTDNLDEALLDDVQWALLEPLKPTSRTLAFEQILALLAHPAPELQLIAGRLIVHHERPAEDVPIEVYARLLESPVAKVRGVGVELFTQLPDSAIAKQPELVESFCLAEEAEIRNAVRPAIGRLSSDYPEFSARLTRKLVDRLFRRERGEGQHSDLHDMLTNELASHTMALNKELNWRLLQARSNAAQALGTWLLPNRNSQEFSVRQWAVLGRHANLEAREWAWQCYRDHPEQVVEQAHNALRMLDSDWDDSREFAFDYFRNQFPADAWQPELMIGVCDSTRADVQRFGRERITMFFKDQDGEEYLLKLSQHPSANVQLFASNYLERYAGDNASRLLKLEPYFVTVLSQVNRNRITKNRITDFLLREATKSQEVAILVARIFARQSVTMAITDKARYLTGMRDLTLQYPDITMPLTIIAAPTYPHDGKSDKEAHV